MRIIRYRDPAGKVGYAAEDAEGAARVIEGDVFGDFEVTDRTAKVEKLLAPVAPPQILCIGLNYRKHAEESGSPIPEYPVLFMKNVHATQNPGDPIELPRGLRSDEIDYECELVVVIGKEAKNVLRADAFDVILGYTCGNDVSSRDWQIKKSGGQFCRGKSFDTFAPIGPAIVTTDEIRDPNQLGIRTILNGDVMQDSNTRDMIFDVPTLIEFLSGSTTLRPGTLLFTGTPSGVGGARKPPVWLRDGDEVTVEIEGIGQLKNPVREEAT